MLVPCLECANDATCKSQFKKAMAIQWGSCSDFAFDKKLKVLEEIRDELRKQNERRPT
jgi:hypothetical protein